MCEVVRPAVLFRTPVNRRVVDMIISRQCWYGNYARPVLLFYRVPVWFRVLLALVIPEVLAVVASRACACVRARSI